MEPFRVVASSIITLIIYWCKSRLDDSYFKLSLILLFDVSSLTRVGSHTDTQDRDNSVLLDSNMDPDLDLEGSDLIDYLRNKAEYDAIDSAAYCLMGCFWKIPIFLLV